MSSLLGWKAYRERGQWVAVRYAELGGYNTTGPVRMRHILAIPADATAAQAEQEIARLIMRGKLKS
ncbi:hypothetical protein K6V98_00035 [Collinsella sp. AGMB00827]|uniref:Uncharacterized protein n=1 Tax=Collinsella ureilytica TaxID=2869515 RepID=A0ABS7MI10_9ACTN|nr:hypothetical protein [Collinsella urealyticum]MBY4796761.1 hypothetical protein [Collinsella urealyticum]